MAITVLVNPAILTWTNFTLVRTSIRDPNDGAMVDALTKFKYELPDLPPRGVQGALADPNVITITPDAH